MEVARLEEVSYYYTFQRWTNVNITTRDVTRSNTSSGKEIRNMSSVTRLIPAAHRHRLITRRKSVIGPVTCKMDSLLCLTDKTAHGINSSTSFIQSLPDHQYYI
ncbi:hypothetical protein E2C01_012904 [Portunus trituberculatus]|uniref:Uncharacterized protein n=1 Tax=Portunus trituberculatus TaxID=210409 RepID=A0A5B7DFX6_PORTR|nr:hypothetical protein [Portunus trituberculatus]